MIKKISFFISTFCFVGLLPKAPGTWGTLAAVPFIYLLMDRPFVLLGALGIVLIVGVVTAGITEKDLGVKDPSCVVIDEVLGMGVTLLWVPKEWPYIVMGVIFFRIFDIWKPPPIQRIEKLPGGWGIMLDDLLGGVYSWVWLQIGAWLIRLIA